MLFLLAIPQNLRFSINPKYLDLNHGHLMPWGCSSRGQRFSYCSSLFGSDPLCSVALSANVASRKCKDIRNSIGSIPIGSRTGIFANIYHKFQPNVGKYNIHGYHGIAQYQSLLFGTDRKSTLHVV